jgi:uncharacterized protein (DUF433 family)
MSSSLYIGMAYNITGGKKMERNQLLERIVVNHKILVGKPVIGGTRLTTQYILNLLAHGATVDEILQEYKELTQEDILACLLYASETLESATFMPLVETV